MKEIDIKGGKITYKQRLELGDILRAERSESSDLSKSVFSCLFGRKMRFWEVRAFNKRLQSYVDDVFEWIHRENEMLHYEPSEEEKRAGVAEYAKRVGDLAMVKCLAKTYAEDPDTILGWEYGKVFGILYTDLEELKYNQNYRKVLEGKYVR